MRFPITAVQSKIRNIHDTLNRTIAYCDKINNYIDTYNGQFLP